VQIRMVAATDNALSADGVDSTERMGGREKACVGDLQLGAVFWGNITQWRLCHRNHQRILSTRRV